MTDPRDREYVELFVHGCLDVQPGWQVIVGGNPRARPLLEAVCAAVARRGSYTDLGGVNQSGIHWDLVKDMRLPGSRLELDGVVVQSDGTWLV